MNERELKRDIPIACNLPEAAQAQRAQELIEQIFKHCRQVTELPDGYEFQFPGDEAMANRLIEFITFERKCCPFFTFELSFAPNQGPIGLRMRGSAEIKQYLATASAALIAPQQ